MVRRTFTPFPNQPRTVFEPIREVRRVVRVPRRMGAVALSFLIGVPLIVLAAGLTLQFMAADTGAHEAIVLPPVKTSVPAQQSVAPAGASSGADADRPVAEDGTFVRVVSR